MFKYFSRESTKLRLEKRERKKAEQKRKQKEAIEDFKNLFKEPKDDKDKKPASMFTLLTNLSIILRRSR